MTGRLSETFSISHNSSYLYRKTCQIELCEIPIVANVNGRLIYKMSRFQFKNSSILYSHSRCRKTQLDFALCMFRSHFRIHSFELSMYFIISNCRVARQHSHFLHCFLCEPTQHTMWKKRGKLGRMQDDWLSESYTWGWTINGPQVRQKVQIRPNGAIHCQTAI